MGMTHDLARAAQDLLRVYETKQPIAPLRETIPQLTVADAYQIQTLQRSSFPGTVVGRKIGLTSAAMQQQLGVDSPDFGFFTDTMLHRDNAHLPVGDFIAPKVEPEFAYLLRKDLHGPGVTSDDVAEAIASVHAAVEVIDSRIRDWDIQLVDTVADNASCGAVVISEAPLPVDPRHLADVRCDLLIDGSVIGTGHGSDVLGDPLAPVAWLANVVSEHGERLEAGQWVLPGSFCAAAGVESGSEVRADFGELGGVSVTF